MEKRGCLILMLFFMIGSVGAISAEVDRDVVVLRGDIGETVEGLVTAVNSNDVIVRVRVFASGSLDVEILDDDFVLEPLKSRDVRFKVLIEGIGRTDSLINFEFDSGEESVGVASQVIVDSGSFTVEGVGSVEEEVVNESVVSEDDDFVEGGLGLGRAEVFLGSSTLVLAILLIVLLGVSRKRLGEK
jgi:hypothetical protein